MTEVTDELLQKAEWRARLIEDVIHRRFDDETLAVMIEAGLSQAYSEGLLDAAEICESVARSVSEPPKRQTASVLGRCLRQLNDLNRKGHG
jgi:hypothetical protein